MEAPPRPTDAPAAAGAFTFLIAAGGTGGHIFPAIEVARVLARQGHRCLFVGAERGMEKQLVPQAGFPLRLIPSGPLREVSWRQRLRTAAALPGALLRAHRLLRETRPEVVLSLGGYASGPLVLAAALRRIPIVVLEPNAEPGLANRLASRFARRALLGFAEAERWFRRARPEVCGVPIRKEFFQIADKKHSQPFMIFITGGSQGSRTLNRAAAESLRIWRERRRARQVAYLHQTGAREYNEVLSQYQGCALKAEVVPFVDDMPAAFARAGLIVCRAGASAVAELCAAGKASILVPFPYAAGQHQLRNAEAMQACGAARLVPDGELTGERLADEIARLLDHPELLGAMEQAARRQARPGAAERAAEALIELARTRT